ncbi:MAG TPA: hypothetical protein VKE40_25960 [Gemmataceae bacterium]|nr:hypothetical protein [Gemmataceae bacterium]
MFRLRWTAVVLAVAGVARADGPVADADLVKFVDERVAKYQPTPEEKVFDTIGWATEILTAEKLAAEHNRPVFLFTHDGHMGVGRC